MNIITRDFVNKNILFEDCELDEVKKPLTFDKLSAQIDVFKNLLQEHGATEGKSIVIGLHPRVEQTACVLACFELGVSIVIIDYGRPDNFTQYKFVDPKTEILSPIDFFIVHREDETDKYDYFSHQCEQTIVTSKFDLTTEKYTKENKEVLATPETIAIKCTSSGTTGTPKKILHTHEFLKEVAVRNSKLYDSNVALTNNLNHGSSVATYYLPAMHSKDVKRLMHLGPSGQDIVTKGLTIAPVKHLMLPYKHMLEEVATYSLPDTTLYTLSMIPKKLRADYRDGHFKDIVSIFGCNETSGPTLINRISEPKFRQDAYFKLDDFYGINIVDKILHVTLPIYGTTVNTADMFLEKNGKYYFQGRKDLQRINGVHLDLNEYTRVASEAGNCNLVFDVVTSNIYLAIWDENEDTEELARTIDSELRNMSRDCHYISKVKVLRQDEFLSGVKVDQELLREYFRNHVTEDTLCT